MKNKMINKLLLALLISIFSIPSFAKGNLPVKEIQNLVEVFNLLKTQYVDEQDSSELIDNAISGMLSFLDSHSSYIKKSKKDDFSNNLNDF